jgi:hypothetical protein
MDHTNSDNGILENSLHHEQAKEENSSNKASLIDLYKYLDGYWFLFVIIGLISAFWWGVGQAFTFAVMIQMVQNIEDDRRNSTLARKFLH